MYNSYKVSFDLKGARLILSFIVGLFISQTLSMITISYLTGTLKV
jgi:hypothetical protein